MRGAALVPIGLALGGLACIADAVIRGTAGVALFVVFPVVYGSDGEFLLGVVLLLCAFLTLPLAVPWSVAPAGGSGPLAAEHRGEAPTTEAVGLVLIGPVPIFFGGWRSVSWKVKVAVAVVGTLLLLGAVLFFVLR
jgi:uncharacterized membrane protein